MLRKETKTVVSMAWHTITRYDLYDRHDIDINTMPVSETDLSHVCSLPKTWEFSSY